MMLRLVSCALLAAAASASLAPQQIHIAFAGVDSDGTPNGMAISWATDGATNTSTVKFGLSSSALTTEVTGTSGSYLKPTVQHHVVLSNLKVDTTYYYTCGDATAGFSDVMSFVTGKPANTQLPLTLAAFGDWGFGKNGNAIPTHTRLMAVKDDIDFVLHVGDISYADDAFLHTPLSFQYENVMNGFMNWIQPVASQKAYMVMPGNHESECHSPACLLKKEYRDGLRNFTAYNARWRMPAEESGAHGLNMFYSFNYGPAHFVAFDTETDYPKAPEATHGDSGVLPAGGFVPEGEQLKWFEADLAKANASRAERPFIIVSGHRPVYTTHNCDSNGAPKSSAADLQAAIEDLLVKYQVDLYLAGHVHAYGRSWPTVKNRPSSAGEGAYFHPQDPTYLVIGGAGCDEMKNKEVDIKATETIPWAAYDDNDHYGMGLLTFNNRTSLTFKWLESTNGTVLDQFTLVRA